MTRIKGSITLLCMVATFLVMVALGRYEFVALVVLVAISMLMLVVNWSVEHLIVFLALLCFGIITEYLATHAGTWSYPTEHWFGFPLWIPFIWSNAAFFIIEVKEWVDVRIARLRA